VPNTTEETVRRPLHPRSLGLSARILASASSLGRALLVLGFGAIAAAFGAFGGPPNDRPPIWGFTAESAERQHQIESRLAALMSPESAMRHLARLTEEPHVAGSPRNYELAQYVRDRFTEYGLEDVEIVRYDVFLPYVSEISLHMVEPVVFTPSLKEDGYPDDKDSYDSAVGVPYHAFSAAVDATAHVVYANSGNPEDYDYLASQGIDVRGKIVLVRYSVPYSYRGFKALTAQQRGAAGIVIYSDPADDGFTKGETYPRGPWGPESHIQRGAIAYDFMIPGDPLTPGYASIANAPRIAKGESPMVPTIASLPLSYRDASPLLENLSGPVAPRGWQGGLPFTYHLGPGPTKLRMKVVPDEAVRPIYNVIGRLRGSEEPEKLVILGNHRDAWIYGAVDPASGTAAQLELARALGSLAREGERPRRTVVFANWDAEEFSLTGSTEWGEQHADELAPNAVAYVNVDSATSGPDFNAAGVPALNRVLFELARDVRDPGTGKSLLEVWEARRKADRSSEATSGVTTAEGDGLVGNRLGSGSDYTVFLNYLGVPVADLAFTGPYGVYHSMYDSFTWMKKFGDPSFRYHAAMAELWGRLALRLASADVLPLDYAACAASIEEFLSDVERKAKERNLAVDLETAREAARKLKTSAERLNRLIETPPPPPRHAVNQALIRAERAFVHADGLPGRTWFKHLLFAPKFTYAPEVLPGIAEALDRGDLDGARREVHRLAGAIENAVSILGGAAPEEGSPQ
jgi:N-acetylated-alpha-linked acidic dipeptidase